MTIRLTWISKNYEVGQYRARSTRITAGTDSRHLPAWEAPVILYHVNSSCSGGAFLSTDSHIIVVSIPDMGRYTHTGPADGVEKDSHPPLQL